MWRVKTVSEYKRNVSPNATHLLHLRCQGLSFSLLGRLEGLGAGAAAAQGRRSQAAQQENLWRRQRHAQAICVRQVGVFKKIA